MPNKKANDLRSRKAHQAKKCEVSHDVVEPSREYDGQADRLSLRDARELFVLELRIFAKDTQRHHKECIVTLEKLLRKQGIEIDDVRDLTSRMIRDKFVYYMLDDMQLKPTTVNTRIRGVRAFTKFLHREGYIAKNIGGRSTPRETRTDGY